MTNDRRFLAVALIVFAHMFLASAAAQDGVQATVINKQVRGCELAFEYLQGTRDDEPAFSPSSLTEEEKIYSIACTGIIGSVLTTLGARGRTELKEKGVCLPKSVAGIDVVDLFPTVLAKMRSRLREPDAYEYYDAVFLVTSSAIDAVETHYACDREPPSD